MMSGRESRKVDLHNIVANHEHKMRNIYGVKCYGGVYVFLL